MLKFKKDIEGFLYDSQLGGCYDLNCDFAFEFEVEDDEEDGYLIKIDDEETLNNLFKVNSKEDLENDEEGLSDFVEWVN